MEDMPRRPRVAAVIPARYGSTRFPGKPLAELAGRPLVAHVVACARRVAAVGRVLVATDDERIAAAAEAAGAEACLTPADLPSGTDRVACVAADLDSDVIVNLQGDEPLLQPEELGRALDAFLDGGEEIGTLRAPLRAPGELGDPNVVKVVVDERGVALYFSRAPIPFERDVWYAAGGERPAIHRRGAAPPPPVAWRHVGVYLYRTPALLRWARMPMSNLERVERLEQLRILEGGGRIVTYEVAAAHPGVDTPQDLERVRRMLEARAARPERP